MLSGADPLKSALFREAAGQPVCREGISRFLPGMLSKFKSLGSGIGDTGNLDELIPDGDILSRTVVRAGGAVRRFGLTLTAR